MVGCLLWMVLEGGLLDLVGFLVASWRLALVGILLMFWMIGLVPMSLLLEFALGLFLLTLTFGRMVAWCVMCHWHLLWRC